MEKLIESLSEIERAIIPYLNNQVDEIVKKSGLDKTTVLRALSFLENKKILKVSHSQKKEITLGVNGVYYKKNHLPERTLLITIEQNNNKTLKEVSEATKLSDNEFRAALGALKNKALISLENGRVKIIVPKDEISKKFPEEVLLEKLPIEPSLLSNLDKQALDNLKSRKNILEIIEKKDTYFELTELGKKIAGKKIESDLIEEITPEIIKEFQKGKRFRRYDLNANVPEIHGGKKHFVNQSIEHGKKIWLELGFKEMAGSLTATSFWNFDALFTAQDHPVREMQDTFFIKNVEGKLPQNQILLQKVKQAHEKGISNSRGWRYNWKESGAKKVLLRTHTTCLSAQTLAKIGQLKNAGETNGKYFAIGKTFRNETVDWKHGFEFNQTEGIVVGKDLNFRHLLGYLKEFFSKMGYDKVRFRPSYFPYTEPSVEIDVWHPERKEWLELGGAGIFRPEVTVPLLGEHLQVLAWGPGFDRTIMEYNEIKDLREMYSNDITKLRNKKILLK